MGQEFTSSQNEGFPVPWRLALPGFQQLTTGSISKTRPVSGQW